MGSCHKCFISGACMQKFLRNRSQISHGRLPTNKIVYQKKGDSKTGEKFSGFFSGKHLADKKSAKLYLKPEERREKKRTSCRRP